MNSNFNNNSQVNSSFAVTTKVLVPIIASVNTATNRIQYLFRKGNKTTTEAKRRNRIKDRALKKKRIDQNKQIGSRFDNFFISATPFVGLKTRRRRRGKRVINKVIAFTRMRSRRKAFLEFVSSFYFSGRTKTPLINRLEQELETLYTLSRKRTVAVLNANSNTLRDKRTVLYKTAYAARGIKQKKNQGIKKSVLFLSSSVVEHMAVNH